MPTFRNSRSAKRKLYCSFCGKSQDEVKKLVAGPAVFICDGCIASCNKIVAAPPGGESSIAVFGEHLSRFPTEKLLEMVKGQEGTLEDARTLLQTTVDILRQREVSWAAIGQALGVSRQAAWERFS